MLLGETPNAPGETPNAPGDAPNAPGETPNVPGDATHAPGDATHAPGETPNAPGETPNAPGESPSAPGDASAPGKYDGCCRVFSCYTMPGNHLPYGQLIIEILTHNIMARKKDWLPHNRQKLFTMATEVAIPYVAANRARFGMADGTPMGDWYISDFIAKGYNPYVGAYAGWVNPETRTKVSIAKMNSAEKLFIFYFRELYKMLKNNPLVKDYDLVAMQFDEGGSTSDSSTADPIPAFTITRLKDHRLRLDYFRDTPDHKKAKPDGQQGVLIAWILSETPVDDQNNFPNTSSATRTPVILQFTPEEQKKTIYIAMRWANMNGEHGPWSNIVSDYVP
jgi:hypothetical protein